MLLQLSPVLCASELLIAPVTQKRQLSASCNLGSFLLLVRQETTVN